MSQLSQGSWEIESVIVNSETVTNCDGFEQLKLQNGRIAILPAGLEFQINRSAKNELVLESQGQKYYGEFLQNERTVQLQLNRPRFTETVTINGRGPSPCNNLAVE